MVICPLSPSPSLQPVPHRRLPRTRNAHISRPLTSSKLTNSRQQARWGTADTSVAAFQSGPPFSSPLSYPSLEAVSPLVCFSGSFMVRRPPVFERVSSGFGRVFPDRAHQLSIRDRISWTIRTLKSRLVLGLVSSSPVSSSPLSPSSLSSGSFLVTVLLFPIVFTDSAIPL